MAPSKSQQEEWDKDFVTLARMLLHPKKGLKRGDAKEVGRKRVAYVRGKDLARFIARQKDVLLRRCKPALKRTLGSERAPQSEKDIVQIVNGLLANKFLVKAMGQTITGEEDTARWPQRLQSVRGGFESDLHYIVLFEDEQGMQYFMLALLIVVVLLGCMFPAWPLWAKVGAWYLLVILLSLYLLLELTRMSLFALFWIVGYDGWLLPNLNDEYLGILDSLKPFWQLEKRDDDKMMIVTRFIVMGLVAAGCEQIASTHSISDLTDFVQGSYEDVFNWGVDRLTALPEAGVIEKLPSYEDILNADDEDDANITRGSAKEGKKESKTDDVKAQAASVDSAEKENAAAAEAEEVN